VSNLVVGTLVAFGTMVATGPQPAEAVANSDWLGIVNTYRQMSGLSPVTARSDWSAEAVAHSCYMLQNGISHDEIPGYPGYTPGGDIAGNSGNVAVSSSVSATARNHIDLWMTGPFHAIGIMRHNLTQSAFGLCAQENTPTPWRSGGTLDVIRGLDYSKPRPSTPTLFPGNGATVPLNSFITEYPNPMTMCNWTGQAGLPLFALMPSTVTSANSTLVGPNGPIETCTLRKGNTNDATADAILGGDNAVVIMPRQVLTNGTYTATINSNGGNVTWSFTVDTNAPLSFDPPDLPSTSPTAGETKFEPITPFRLVDTRQRLGALRLRAKTVTKITIGTPDITAVSANFTAVDAGGGGFLTAYNCTTPRPDTSTVNYRVGRNVANQAIVPLQNGKLCLYTHADVDVVIDVNGYYRETGSPTGFNPITPQRMVDTREPGFSILRPGQELSVPVAGVAGGAPADADGVALNVTVVNTTGKGWLKAYPCGGTRPEDLSSINFVTNDVRANSVVVPVGSGGRVCFEVLRTTHVIVDITGYFTQGAGLDLVPLDPIRLLDTREYWENINPFTGGDRVAAGRTLRLRVAGVRGVPADAKAASVNITVTQPDQRTFVTAYPCGTRPDTSSLNLLAEHGVAANGAMVKLSSTGDLCLYTNRAAHLIVDINGVWR
jgi:hypothetical protein